METNQSNTSPQYIQKNEIRVLIGIHPFSPTSSDIHDVFYVSMLRRYDKTISCHFISTFGSEQCCYSGEIDPDIRKERARL